MLDHCSRFQTFLRIALPLALPSIGATGLFAFMLSYSEYMFSMVLSGDAATRPVSVVMAALARNTDVSWSLLNTAIFIAIVPTLVLVVLRLALRGRRPAQRRGQGISMADQDDTHHPLKTRPQDARQHVTAGPYSPVLEVDARRLVVISGQVAVDMDGKVIGRHDRGADARHAGQLRRPARQRRLHAAATSSRSTST